MHTINSQRRLRDVGGDNTFSAARRRWVEDHRLDLRRQRRVHRENDEGRRVCGLEALHAFVEGLTGGVDLLLASEEQQDVPRGLAEMNLQHRYQGGLYVVCLGLFGVQYFNWERPPWDREDARVEEIVGKLLSIQSG